MTSKLAVFGGAPAINRPHPHEVWPLAADQSELDELALQRNIDIGIRGRSGPVREFEELFLNFLDNQVRYAVTFNSGTSALLAAYVGLGVGHGDEVIGPALTYHAAMSPLFLLGATPVLVDIERRTRCIDHKAIERAITPRTKAITLVHQWGHPCDMEAVNDIAERHNLYIIEDCSHAHGSRYKGKLCGTFGNVSTFSLQTNKAMFAGEGGILVTNQEVVHDRATLLGHYRERSRDEIKDPYCQQYWVTGFGLKLRMSPFNAIVAKHSLRHFPEIVTGRHQCLHYFRHRIEAEVPFLEAPFVARFCDMGAWYGFKPLYHPERLSGLSRDALIKALRAEGMEVSVPSGPVLVEEPLYSDSENPIFPKLRKVAASVANVPVACEVARRALSLPTFWNWEQDKSTIDQYIEAFIKVAVHHSELLPEGLRT